MIASEEREIKDLKEYQIYIMEKELKELKQRGERMKFEYVDQIIFDALRRRRKVELFLCKDVEGGFGIKIDGKQLMRNFAWESFEYPISEYLTEAQIKRFANSSEVKK